MPPVCDPHLGAIDAIDPAVPSRSGGNVLEIRARAWFGKADSPTPIAGRQNRQKAMFLLCCSESNEYICQNQMRTKEASETEPSSRQFAKDAGESYVVY